MANLYNNISIIRLTNASDDQFVDSKTCLGKAILASKPLFDDTRNDMETKTQQIAVREGTTYANFAQTQKAYIKQAKGKGITAYYAALADWFVAPKVLEIDVDNWTGKIGQTIRVKARDNVMVARVSVVIRDEEENVLEMGEAVQSERGSTWWNYTTKSLVTMTPFPIVEVTAQDLAGNSDSFAIS
jgi:hypothetical protein